MVILIEKQSNICFLLMVSRDESSYLYDLKQKCVIILRIPCVVSLKLKLSSVNLVRTSLFIKHGLLSLICFVSVLVSYLMPIIEQ